MGCDDRYGDCRRRDSRFGPGRDFRREHRPERICDRDGHCPRRREFFEDEFREDRKIIIPIFPRRFW